jgi:putative Mn2+ efflux pump MntP
MNTAAHIDPSEKAAYVKAQKTRNLYIGFALLVFVGLVFTISVVRMSEGVANDKAHREAAEKMSNIAAPAKP